MFGDELGGRRGFRTGGGSLEGLAYATIDPRASRSRPAGQDAAEQPRTWTSAGGQHTMDAKLVGLAGGDALLENAEGRRVRVPLEKLSEADQQYIDQWRERHRP